MARRNRIWEAKTDGAEAEVGPRQTPCVILFAAVPSNRFFHRYGISKSRPLRARQPPTSPRVVVLDVTPSPASFKHGNVLLFGSRTLNPRIVRSDVSGHRLAAKRPTRRFTPRLQSSSGVLLHRLLVRMSAHRRPSSASANVSYSVARVAAALGLSPIKFRTRHGACPDPATRENLRCRSLAPQRPMLGDLMYAARASGERPTSKAIDHDVVHWPRSPCTRSVWLLPQRRLPRAEP